MTKSTAALALLSLILSFNTSAKVESSGNGGFIVLNTVSVNAAADTVWQALVNDVDQWWPKDHSWWTGTFSIDARAGGCFCERAGERSAEHMRISFVDPAKQLVMTGGLGPLQAMGMTGALNWQLEQTGADTTISLRYHVQGYSESGYKDLAPVVDHVQGLQLKALADFLTTAKTD